MRTIIAACSLSALLSLALLPAGAAADQVSPDALVGKWLVQDISGLPSAQGVRSTIEIQPDGAVGGSGGCNRFFGALQNLDGKVTFGGMGSTMMACETAAMEQEHNFLTTLESVESWKRDGATLTLLNEQGKGVITLVSLTTLTLELPNSPPPETQTVTYHCDDRTLSVQYINSGTTSLALLPLGGGTVVATTVLAGSGAKYAGQQYVWWTKGAHADLYDLMQGEDAKPVSCDAME